jgi:glycosyltransferase involved in cell wall biosynthesis
MTPPVIACLAVWLYTKLMKASYAIDAHSGALLDPRWRSTLFLHRFFSRHAVTTFVTSTYLQDLILAWGANSTIVSDVPIHFADPIAFVLNGECNMTFVSTFTKDEPVELFLKAAQRLPNIRFFITGDCEDADSKIFKSRPDNVEFTGFLSDSEYAGLLMASDAIICLTKEDHTMQRGAYEAIYLGKPVITSKFDILRKAFHKGAIHVDNTVEDITAGVIHMKNNIEQYRTEAQELKLEKVAKWQKVENDLRQMFFDPAKSSSNGIS